MISLDISNKYYVRLLMWMFIKYFYLFYILEFIKYYIDDISDRLYDINSVFCIGFGDFILL